MRALKINLNQAGDTIVEVLVATAILAAVLGGAYAISSRALRSGRIAQERIEALKLVEGQVERLKHESKVSGNFDSAYRIEPGNYCLFTDVATGNTAPYANPNPDAGNYHNNCLPPNTIYKLNITYANNPAFTDPNKRFGTFRARAVWARFGGGQEELVVDYQL